MVKFNDENIEQRIQLKTSELIFQKALRVGIWIN